jgi:hypothetical protein
MKNQYLLTPVLMLCCILFACNKGNGTLTPLVRSSLSFSANDTMISFPMNLAFIQDVNNIHTTLISGQYADTSSKQGNISLRLVGDTTGRYREDSLLITYTNASGMIYYKTSDTSNFVQVDKFPKTPNGMVSGSFTCIVANGNDSIRFINGIFSVPFQD